jgi:nitroreductase
MILQIIKDRRSTRNYAPEAVPIQDLVLLLDAARWAPSGGNRQPWHIIIVRDRANIERIESFAPGLRGEPPVLLILCDDTSIEGNTHIMDLAMACQNILLAAASQGLGTCAVRSFSQKALRRLLYLPQHVSPELIVSVGYPGRTTKAPARRELNEILHWELYGGEPCDEARTGIQVCESDLLHRD